MLIGMANHRQQGQAVNTASWFFSAYSADTLYVLTKNQDAIVTQLVDLGKKWQADSVEIYDS